MAIGTYSELQTAIANWINRTDLTDRLPEFIALAEAHFNRKLRVPEMENAATATLSAETIALPTDFLAVRSIYLNRNPRVELDYVAYGTLRTQYADTTAGMPEVYTLADGAFYFGPAPDQDYTIDIVYWQKIPALSGSQTTNWLLAAHPDVYLYGSLAHAAHYIREDVAVATFTALTEGLLAGIEQAGVERAASGTPLVARRRAVTWGPTSAKGVW